MKKKICAVVVTYNRKQLLIECLRGILSQTVPVDSILIIDNASSDGTDSLLLDNKYINQDQLDLASHGVIAKSAATLKVESELGDKEWLGTIIYIKQGYNSGGAGGFYEGLKCAYEEGYDWIWLMDDDVEPYSEAFEVAEKYLDRFNCVQFSRIDSQGKDFPWDQNYVADLNIVLPFRNSINKEFSLVNTCSFEGFLLNRVVIDDVGLPPKNFFFRWDDLLYGYMCSRKHGIVYLKNAKLKRKLKTPKKLSKLAIYYEFRNRIAVRRLIFGGVNIRSDLRVLAIFIEILAIIKSLIKWPKLSYALLTGAYSGYMEPLEVLSGLDLTQFNLTIKEDWPNYGLYSDKK